MLKIFSLKESQVNASKAMYNGKIIKCLIDPHHNLDDVTNYIGNGSQGKLYIFPENNMSLLDTQLFIKNLVDSEISEPITIITANQNIIMDMIGDCVGILNTDYSVSECNSATLYANLYDIQRICGLKRCSVFAANKLKELIDAVAIFETDSTLIITSAEYTEIKESLDIIGDEVFKFMISNKLEKIKNR